MNVDPYPAINFNADPDPDSAPHHNDANLVYKPSRVPLVPSRFNCE